MTHVQTSPKPNQCNGVVHRFGWTAEDVGPYMIDTITFILYQIHIFVGTIQESSVAVVLSRWTDES